MLKTCSQNYLKEILNKRIGHGAADALDIMDHPFFENIDWDMLLRKEILPPYIPKTKKIDDLRHIDPMFKNEIVKDTPNERELDLQEKEKNHFKEFTYCKEVNTGKLLIFKYLSYHSLCQ